ELDLVDPAFAGRRLWLERCKLGGDEVRHRGLLGSLQGGKLGLFLDLPGLRRPAGSLVLDILDDAARLHRFRPLLEDVWIVFGAGGFVVALDEQPVVALLARPPRHADEMPAAAELLAFQLEFQMALLQAFVRVAKGCPRPAIPDDHGTTAILALGDRA